MDVESRKITDDALSLPDPDGPTPQNNVIVFRKAKKKKRPVSRREFDVQVIPATKGLVAPGEPPPVKRVAAYCRVSTDEDAQATSYELQVQHYTEYISTHEGWVLAGIYADEGISGTQVKHREQFKKMIEDCKSGLIDLVITKSISRFARNQVDCITTIRDLKALKNPVEIFFEKERMSSLDEKMDMFLGMMASFAQEESRSISANIRWAIRNRMKNGTQKVSTAALLGYDTDDDGNMVIIETEAEIVRIIYKSFIQGVHPKLIATRLNGFGMTTVLGNQWTSGAVRNILRNEKYCGDVLMQKTITIDYLTHASKVNEGEAEQYYIADHHDPIVNREIWDKAQELLDKSNWKRWKKREQMRLIPIRTGRLIGFISINRSWQSISLKRLLSASGKIHDLIVDDKVGGMGSSTEIHESEVNDMPEKKILKGFEVVELEEAKSDSVMTLTSSNLKFNKATAVELGFPSTVRMLVNAATRKVAIEPCTENAKNAIPFSKNQKTQTYSVVLKIPALLTAARKLAEVEEIGDAISFKGKLFPEDHLIIFDLSEPITNRRQGRRKKQKDVVESEPSQEVAGEDNEVEEEEPVVQETPKKRGRPKKK